MFMNSFHTHLLIIGITLDIRGGKEETDMNKTHFSASEKPIDLVSHQIMRLCEMGKSFEKYKQAVLFSSQTV